MKVKTSADYTIKSGSSTFGIDVPIVAKNPGIRSLIIPKCAQGSGENSNKYNVAIPQLKV